MSPLACIDQPISWLRLERYATDPADPTIAPHLAACPACARCLAQITGDVVALPALVITERRARPARGWWARIVPGFALVAAAAVVILVVIGLPHGPAREGTVSIKGVGDVVVDVVRERGGVIRTDVRSFVAGDRWKIVVTCPPAASATFAVSVADGRTIDRPLSAARLACGNRVILPGAFTLSGLAPNRVCVQVTADAGTSGEACVTISPE